MSAPRPGTPNQAIAASVRRARAEAPAAVTYVRPIIDAVAQLQRAEQATEAAREARDLRIAEALRAGLSLDQAATVAGMSYANVRVIARKHGIRLKPGRRPRAQSA